MADASSPRTVIFLRHGETELNRDGDRFCGTLDPPLSETGIREAARAAGALSPWIASIDRAWTSPLIRARQTAERLGYGGDWEVVQELRELSFGQWEGLTKTEACKQTPERYDAWERDAYRNQPPGGVSGEQAESRVWELVERIQEMQGSTVLIVSHRTFLRLFVGLLLGVEPRTIRHALDIQTGKIGILELRGRSGTMKAFNL